MATSGMDIAMSSIMDQLFKEDASTGTTEPGIPTAHDPEDAIPTAHKPEPDAGMPSMADILKICMYSQSVPVITEEAYLEMESNLPRFVELLHGLAGRPGAMAQFKQFATELSKTGSDSSAELLAQALGAPQDMGDNDERILPALLVAVIGLGVGSAALGYNMGHTWGK